MTPRAGRLVLLDPFTVVAQVVNFLVLLVALKHVLFDRVVEAIDAREREIASRLDVARDREAEAAQQAADLDRAHREFDARSERMSADVRAQVDEQRASMLAEVRRELDDRRAHWERALRQEHERLLRDVDRRVADALFELLRDALGRLADVELERRVVDTAFDHFVVDDVVVGEFESIGDRGSASAGPIEVTTSFEPGDAGRRHVLDRLAALGVLGVADRETDGETDGETDRESDRAGGGDLRVSFRRDPRLVIGVRLRVAETSVEWSANDYLERFRSIVEIGLFEGEDG